MWFYAFSEGEGQGHVHTGTERHPLFFPTTLDAEHLLKGQCIYNVILQSRKLLHNYSSF